VKIWFVVPITGSGFWLTGQDFHIEALDEAMSERDGDGEGDECLVGEICAVEDVGSIFAEKKLPPIIEVGDSVDDDEETA
jgi:hypothetical protein